MEKHFQVIETESFHGCIAVTPVGHLPREVTLSCAQPWSGFAAHGAVITATMHSRAERTLLGVTAHPSPAIEARRTNSSCTPSPPSRAHTHRHQPAARLAFLRRRNTSRLRSLFHVPGPSALSRRRIRAVSAKKPTMARAETPFGAVDNGERREPVRRRRHAGVRRAPSRWRRSPAVLATVTAELHDSRVPRAAPGRCHRVKHPRCAQARHAKSIRATSCSVTAPTTRLRLPTPPPRRASARPWWMLPHTYTASRRLRHVVYLPTTGV